MSNPLNTTETVERSATNQGEGFTQLLRDQLPTLLVLLVLGGIAFWGYRTEWKFVSLSSDRNDSSTRKENGTDEDDSTKLRVVPPESPDKACPLAQTRIKFPSAKVVEQAGIEVASAEEKPVVARLTAPAEIDYDPTRVTRLSSPVAGRIWRVEKEVGERVRKGDVLVLLDAAKVGETKAEFLQSLTQLDLQAATLENMRQAGEGVAQRRVREAEASLRDARVRMFNAEQALVNLGLPIRGKDVSKLSEDELTSKVRFLGLPELLIKSLDSETASSNLLPIRAPFDGVIAERQAALDEVVDPTKTLFVVADLSRVWVVMNVRQEDRDKVAMKQPITFAPDGHPDEVVQGEVSFISTTVDEKTRQMRTRAVVENPKEHLPAGTFGTAQITIRDTSDAIVVPAEAIQREGQCHFVFVQETKETFQARHVRVGVSSGESVEIVDGVRPGDVVVTTGSFVLKSEILKKRLGEQGD